MGFCKSIFFLVISVLSAWGADKGALEEQISEIGKIPNEEIVVVQKKYTTKQFRHELTPVAFGGLPFNTVRRTLFGGASYNLHLNDWLSVQVINFMYSKNFFSSFTDDINNNRRTGQSELKPDIQKLIMLGTMGLEWTPFYGKFSTFSRWIAYVDPFLSFNLGLAKTETKDYLTYAPGLGFRVFFREWVSMKLELKDYMYQEKYVVRETGLEAQTLRHNWAIMASLSFWLPKMPTL